MLNRLVLGIQGCRGRASSMTSNGGFAASGRRLASSGAGAGAGASSGRAQLSRQAQFSVPELEAKRIVPVEATFYARNPLHEKNMLHLNNLLRKYITLPTTAVANHKWLSFDQYKTIGGGKRLKPSEYKSFTALLNRLGSIDAQLVPAEISDSIAMYSRNNDSIQQPPKPQTLDKFGRSKTRGTRKSSEATVFLVKGEGEVLINGQSLATYFFNLRDRETIMYPLKVVQAEGLYNISVKTSGGGPTGQSGAIASAISKGLVIHNPLLKPRLYKAGCMTVDSRRVERKKPGHRKARKMPTWVKR